MANQFDVERIKVEGHEESYLITLHNPETVDSLAIEQTCHGDVNSVKSTMLGMLTIIPSEAAMEVFGIDMSVFSKKK